MSKLSKTETFNLIEHAITKAGSNNAVANLLYLDNARISEMRSGKRYLKQAEADLLIESYGKPIGCPGHLYTGCRVNSIEEMVSLCTAKYKQSAVDQWAKFLTDDLLVEYVPQLFLKRFASKSDQVTFDDIVAIADCDSTVQLFKDIGIVAAKNYNQSYEKADEIKPPSLFEQAFSRREIENTLKQVTNYLREFDICFEDNRPFFSSEELGTAFLYLLTVFMNEVNDGGVLLGTSSSNEGNDIRLDIVDIEGVEQEFNIKGALIYEGLLQSNSNQHYSLMNNGLPDFIPSDIANLFNRSQHPRHFNICSQLPRLNENILLSNGILSVFLKEDKTYVLRVRLEFAGLVGRKNYLIAPIPSNRIIDVVEELLTRLILVDEPVVALKEEIALLGGQITTAIEL